MSSTWMLCLANLAPVIGVLFFGWRLGDVLVLYWAESAVIGLFNVPKLLLIGKAEASGLALFFVVHYGFFMLGHYAFINAMFLKTGYGGQPAPLALPVFDAPLLAALAALLASHGYSFWANYLGRREYEHADQERALKRQMFAPYARIFVMHLTIIVGGILAQRLGTPLWALACLAVLKTAVDLLAHLREHRAPTAA